MKHYWSTYTGDWEWGGDPPLYVCLRCDRHAWIIDTANERCFGDQVELRKLLEAIL